MSSELLPAWRQWQPQQLEQLPSRALQQQTAREAEQVRARLAALLKEAERTRAQAQAQGYAAGDAAGHAAGYARGLEEGRAAAAAEQEAALRDALAPVRQLLVDMQQALAALDGTIAASVADIAVLVGQQLADQAFTVDPKRVLQQVRKLMRNEPLLSGHPCLWLGGEDLDLVQGELGEELAALGWQLRLDPALLRGSCRVTGAEGEVDASREMRWHALQQDLSTGHGAREPLEDSRP